MTYLEFYCPHSIELLFDLFYKFNIKTNESYNKKSKQLVLNAIKVLLSQNIIMLGSFDDGENFIEWNIKKEDVLKKIDRKWKIDAEFPDFYNIVWIKYQDWYVYKLKDMGFKSTTNWSSFIENEIGDLEQWIKDNKPKVAADES